MNYLVGLTGGIGSGKSTVAEMFAALGVRIVDTDVISRELTGRGGAAIPALREAFGDGCIAPDGSLDRARMRETVFTDPGAKRRLEAILHPLILARAKELAALPGASPYTMVVVPLLFEGGRYADWLHRVITVDCPESMQIARTMRRGNLSESEVRAIMTTQLDREKRRIQADEVIRNDGSLDDLRAQVVRLHLRLSALAAKTD